MNHASLAKIIFRQCKKKEYLNKIYCNYIKYKMNLKKKPERSEKQNNE